MPKNFVTPLVGLGSGSEIRLIGAAVGEGRLHSVTVIQTAGTSAGFDVEVISAKGACPPNFPAVDAAAAPPGDARLYRAIPPLAAAAGVAQWFSDEGQPFENYDSTSRTAVNAVYVRITPSGGVVGKTFDVSLGIEAL
jgi:hypothetical protein